LGRLRVKTLDIYVAKQFLAAYLVCLVSFVGLFIVVEAFAKLDRFLHQQEVSLPVALFKYHVAMVPTVYVNFLGPILTLAAGMFTMTSLNRRNELIPLKTAGVSVYRTMLPIFALTFLFMALGFYLRDQVLPRFQEPIREALSLQRGQKPLAPQPYHDPQNGIWIRVSEYSTTARVGQGVEVSKLYSDQKPSLQIDANRIEWVPSPGKQAAGGKWILRAGSIQRWDDQGSLVVNAAATGFERLKEPFKEMELVTTLRPIDLEASDTEISYLSWKDLKEQYQRQPYHRHLAVKLHHYFAFPLAHIILLFLGLPFVLAVSPKSIFLSLIVCFSICALFFLVSSICMNTANQSQFLSPILAAWLPVLLFGALGITLFDRLPT
jgi:lipopolysaccharide export system permease protein